MDQARFEDIVKNGLVADIILADESLSILKIFGSDLYLKNISKLLKYKSILNSLYYSTESTFLMALSRIYDSQSKKYPIRSLNQLASYLKGHDEFLQNIRQPFQLLQHLKSFETPIYIMRFIDHEPERFASAYSTYIHAKLEDPVKKKTVELLKNLRDKSLAHNELRIMPFEGIKWDDLIKLLEFAKEVVGTIGAAYLSILYSNNGNYFLTQDTQRTGRSFETMLKQLLK